MGSVSEKYNIVMPETDDRTVCMEVDKPISKEGYRDNFLPRLQEILDKHGEIRILVYFKTYKGWEEEAVGFDMESTLVFGRHVVKMAVVNPPEKMIFSLKMRQPMIHGDLEFFNEADLQKAISWVKA